MAIAFEVWSETCRKRTGWKDVLASRDGEDVNEPFHTSDQGTKGALDEAMNGSRVSSMWHRSEV